MKDTFIGDFVFMGDLVVAEIILVIESFALLQTSSMWETSQSLLDVMSETPLTSKTKYHCKYRVLIDLHLNGALWGWPIKGPGVDVQKVGRP